MFRYITWDVRARTSGEERGGKPQDEPGPRPFAHLTSYPRLHGTPPGLLTRRAPAVCACSWGPSHPASTSDCACTGWADRHSSAISIQRLIVVLCTPTILAVSSREAPFRSRTSTRATVASSL